MDELRYEGRLDLLKDWLPHGSGFNGDWSLGLCNDKVVASNTFSTMVEGMYCHDIGFDAHIQIRPWFSTKRCKYCSGKGYRTIKSLTIIGRHESQAACREMLESHGNTIVFHEAIRADAIECNVCHGWGKVKLPPFDLIEIEMAEVICECNCDDGLLDYIEETIVLSLDYEAEKYIQGNLVQAPR